MVDKIIRYSIEHRFFVLLLVAALLCGGVYSLITLNVDSTPDITNNQVQVITSAENLSTTDIEQFVTYPVELAMSNLPGVEDIRSISRFGLSVVTVVFEDNMGTYLPRQLVQEKLEEVREQIPDGFGTPEMGPITTGLGEIFQYTLVPKDTATYTTQELRTIQDWLVKRQLAMIPGVVEVNSFGGSIKQYEISLSSEMLNARHVTIGEVMEALSHNNVNTGGAYIERNHMASFIRGEGLVKNIEDIENIVVKTENGIPLLIRDVAVDVHFGQQVRYGAFTQDGHEAVGGMILMLKGANSKKVISDVKSRMAEVQKSLPKDIEIRPFLDRSELIKRTTSTLAENLIIGALIVIFILVLIMGSLRGGMLTASVIPLSLLFAFILMRLTGVWANLMSLGAIDFGIVIDGAVIIVEAVAVCLKNQTDRSQMNQLTQKAASTMMGSAFFGQLIILIVFTPILFLPGVSGKMFRPMAFTFSFAILGAILLCLTYVPVMASLCLRPFKNPQSRYARMENWLEQVGNRVMGAMHRLYEPLLNYSMAHKRLVISGALVVFLLTSLLFLRMGSEFIPTLDEGDIAMQTFLRPGSSLSETIKREEEVERLLLKTFPEIKTVCARIGVADIPTDPMGFDYTDSFIILEKDRSKWTSAKTKDELIEKIEETLQQLPGLNYSFSQPVDLRFNELLTGIREDVAVKLYGEDIDTLNTLGERMEEIIRKVPGACDVTLERTSGLPQITIKYDRQRVAQYGLNIEKLNQYVSAAFAGGKAGVIFEGEKRFDMVVRLNQHERTGIEDIENLYVDLPDGQLIPLKEVADINYQPGPMQISRDKASRHIYVGINVRGRDVSSVVEDIQQHLDKELHMPAGYHIVYGGEFENLQEARNRLYIVIPLALLLIFTLLYLALHSFKQVLIIYMTLPLAAIGGVLALLLRGMPFSISAGVGFIVLFGVVVLNGLVLINRFNSLKQEGVLSISDRIRQGTHERLRPILLTASTDVLGFLPMAVSQSAGAEVQRPLATVVIGGILSATLLTLIVIPIIYAWLENGQEEQTTHPSSAKFAVLLALLISPLYVSAQTPISIQEARELTLQYYPTLQAAQLRLQAQQKQQATAWDIGKTEISFGQDEVGHNNPESTTNLIQIRQELDILGIWARSRHQKQQALTLEAEKKLQEQLVLYEMSCDYALAAVSAQRAQLLASIDSSYQRFARAAEKRFETGACTQLELLSAQNQARQSAINLLQAHVSNQQALLNMNRWLKNDANDITYSPLSTDFYRNEGNDLPAIEQQLPNAQILLAEARINQAQAATAQERSAFLPTFYAQYGSQKIGTETGYHAYEVGMSFPLIFGAQAARTKAAKFEEKAAEADLQATRLTQENNRLKNQQELQISKETVIYYEQVALPLAREQQKVAILSYELGQTNYLGFLQNTRDALQIQLDYLQCLLQLYKAHFKLEFNQ